MGKDPFKGRGQPAPSLQLPAQMLAQAEAVEQQRAFLRQQERLIAKATAHDEIIRVLVKIAAAARRKGIEVRYSSLVQHEPGIGEGFELALDEAANEYVLKHLTKEERLARQVQLEASEKAQAPPPAPSPSGLLLP